MPEIFNKIDKIKPAYDLVYKVVLLICKLLLVADIVITSCLLYTSCGILETISGRIRSG